MNLEAIIQSLKAERNRIDQAIAALDGSTSSGRRSGPRHMSAAAKARISAAQKARWAKVRAKKK